MRFLATFLLFIALSGGFAHAEDDHEAARRALQSGQIVALTGILAQVESQFEGRVIEVELIQDTAAGNGFVYKVEVLTATGTLVEIFYDAKTGEPIALGGQGIIEERTEN